MAPPRMVHLTETATEFAARVMVAKLGSAGILAEVRGVSSPYPNLGVAHVYVEEAEYVDARELIRADLEDSFPIEEGPTGTLAPRPARSLARPLLLATSLLLLGSFTLDHCSPAAPAVRAH